MSRGGPNRTPPGGHVPPVAVVGPYAKPWRFKTGAAPNPSPPDPAMHPAPYRHHIRHKR
jgi:hypothetical protein